MCKYVGHFLAWCAPDGRGLALKLGVFGYVDL